LYERLRRARGARIAASVCGSRRIWAIRRRNVVSAVAAAKQLPQLNLVDALELTILVACTEVEGDRLGRRLDVSQA
jgi:hypothetical protein